MTKLDADHKKCKLCGSQYMVNLPRKDGDGTGICATPLCFAKARWTKDEWEGRARMAQNRKACSIPLDAVDIEALHRSRVLQ